jgi:hypothetical protein
MEKNYVRAVIKVVPVIPICFSGRMPVMKYVQERYFAKKTDDPTDNSGLRPDKNEGILPVCVCDRDLILDLLQKVHCGLGHMGFIQKGRYLSKKQRRSYDSGCKKDAVCLSNEPQREQPEYRRGRSIFCNTEETDDIS